MTAQEKLKEIIEAVVKQGIEVELAWDEECNQIVHKVAGFYKSGYATLVIEDNQIVAHTRYDTVDEINSLEDLAELNKDWKFSSCEKTWKDFDHNWKTLLKELDLIA